MFLIRASLVDDRYYIVRFTRHDFTTPKLFGQLLQRITNLLHQAADLLCYLFGFGCFVYVKLTTDLMGWLNPIQSNRRSAAQ